MSGIPIRRNSQRAYQDCKSQLMCSLGSHFCVLVFHHIPQCSGSLDADFQAQEVAAIDPTNTS